MKLIIINTLVCFLIVGFTSGCDIALKRKPVSEETNTAKQSTTENEKQPADSERVKSSAKDGTEAEKSSEQTKDIENAKQEKAGDKSAEAGSNNQADNKTQTENKSKTAEDEKTQKKLVHARRSKLRGITTASIQNEEQDKKQTTQTVDMVRTGFSVNDQRLVNLYYSDKGNARVLNDMVKHTRVSEKVSKKLTVGNRIPSGVQVVPLPLELERILSPLRQNVMRVQVSKKIILMNVKSRRIIDIVEL